jgi:predicted nucleic acid-binding protein
LDADLSFVDNEGLAGPPLLLDTCVYLHVLRGKTPDKVDALLRSRTLLHSAVAIGELANRLGARVPSNAKDRAARAKLSRAIADIPEHRVVTPSVAMWGEAGILVGLHARLAGFNRGQEQDSLNDAILLVQAHAAGAIVLTENLADFDILQQLVPHARVLFYRANP